MSSEEICYPSPGLGAIPPGEWNVAFFAVDDDTGLPTTWPGASVQLKQALTPNCNFADFPETFSDVAEATSPGPAGGCLAGSNTYQLCVDPEPPEGISIKAFFTRACSAPDAPIEVTLPPDLELNLPPQKLTVPCDYWYTTDGGATCNLGQKVSVYTCDEGESPVLDSVILLGEDCEALGSHEECDPPPADPAYEIFLDAECESFTCDYLASADVTLDFAALKAEILAKFPDWDYLSCFTFTLAFCNSQNTSDGSLAATAADAQILGPTGQVVVDLEQGGMTSEFGQYKGEDAQNFYGIQITAGSRVRVCGLLSNDCEILAAEILC